MMPLMKVDTGDLRRRTLLSVKPMGGAGVLPERSDGNLKTVRFLCP
ncbi:hypothetical protein Metig_0782 [Methanotorris igneus Kol 5]|uniref:Uncharacterized protein n=2 Tax=Methanotorris igneus (strain DSM 5666 / JCM 11834 / Kol 5) TaxID=880724 RepID=F6BCW7_METIK|nr:hypothetical protein Metig_0782 [Methanotorris igneus Kol 5]